MAVIATLMVGAVVLRLGAFSGRSTIVMLTALVPLLLFGAPLVAGWAFATRRWILLGLMAMVSVLHLNWVAGDMGSSTGPPADVLLRDVESVRIATVNVAAANASFDRLLASVLDFDADVVVMQEVTPELVAEVEENDAWTAWPHTLIDSRPGFFGSAILSTLPLTDGGVVWVDGWPMTAATVQTQGGGMTVVNVHVDPPLSSPSVDRWGNQIAELTRLAADFQTPLVMAGDFNATASHRPMRALMDTLQDSHLLAGDGVGATWPSGGLTPAVLRLDRILASDHFVVVASEAVDVPGSDHRAVLADLRWVDPVEFFDID